LYNAQIAKLTPHFRLPLHLINYAYHCNKSHIHDEWWLDMPYASNWLHLIMCLKWSTFYMVSWQF